MPNIIQKDVTFEFNFVFPIIGAKKGISKLKRDYAAEIINTEWSWKSPFKLKVFARVNIKHDVDIEKIRNAQHDIATNKGVDDHG